MTELRPAQQDPQWDPTVADPLYTDEDRLSYEELLRLSKDGVTGPFAGKTWTYTPEEYRRKPGVSRAALVWGFAALVVVLAILAAALLVAAPRAAPDRVFETPRTVGPTTDHQEQPGASHGPVVGAMPTGRAAWVVVDSRSDGSGGDTAGDAPQVLPDTSTSVSGTASWYCGGGSACTRGYPPGTLAAAAGPALRVGDWRGRIVKVCSSGRCVKVQLVDWCFCGSGRVIDLYRSAFSRLANPSRGLLRVSITWGGSTVVLPPTDTR